MRQFIRLIALSILLATTLFWLTQGAHREWSQLYTTRTEIDPTTQIEYEVREDHYVPGLDFLGLSVLVSFLVFSTSFAFRRRPRGGWRRQPSVAARRPRRTPRQVWCATAY